MKSPVVCDVCQKKNKSNETMSGEEMLFSTLEFLLKDAPDLDPEKAKICMKCVNSARAKQITKLLEEEKGKLSDLEKEVIESIREHEIISENPNEEYEDQLSFGDRVADKIANFGGSWFFILSFGLVLISWIGLNTMIWVNRSVDPYPLVFLNLILSCLAALQAPFIMMSQNRQSEKDRIHAELDYQVNLKAEIQIRNLNRKMDQFITQQWQKFIEIQQIQAQILENKK